MRKTDSQGTRAPLWKTAVTAAMVFAGAQAAQAQNQPGGAAGNALGMTPAEQSLLAVARNNGCRLTQSVAATTRLPMPQLEATLVQWITKGFATYAERTIVLTPAVCASPNPLATRTLGWSTGTATAAAPGLPAAPGQARATPGLPPAPGQARATPGLPPAPGQARATPGLPPAPGQAAATPGLPPAPGQPRATPGLPPAPGQAAAAPALPKAPGLPAAPGQPRVATGLPPAPGQDGATPGLPPAPGQAAAPAPGLPPAPGQANAAPNYTPPPPPGYMPADSRNPQSRNQNMTKLLLLMRQYSCYMNDAEAEQILPTFGLTRENTLPLVQQLEAEGLLGFDGQDAYLSPLLCGAHGLDPYDFGSRAAALLLYVEDSGCALADTDATKAMMLDVGFTVDEVPALVDILIADGTLFFDANTGELVASTEYCGY